MNELWLPKSEYLTISAVEWKDAAYQHFDDQECVPHPMLTFGYVLEKNDDYVKLAGEVWADDGTRHIYVIPASWATVHKVGRIKQPDSFKQYRRLIGFHE